MEKLTDVQGIAMGSHSAMTYNWDALEGKICRSSRLLDLVGIPSGEDEPTLTWWMGLIEDQDRTRVLDSLFHIRESHHEHAEVRYRIKHADGSWRWVADEFVLFHDGGDRITRIIGCVREIVEPNRSDSALISRVEQLEDENERLKLAMRETNHRVKNHLQAIASLSEMRDGEDVTEADLRRVGLHAQSFALLHDILTKPESRNEGEYDSAKDIVGRLAPLLQSLSGGRPIRCECVDFPLVPRQSTALALVIGELVSNCLKHGDGQIRISLKRCDGYAKLIVADRGGRLRFEFRRPFVCARRPEPAHASRLVRSARRHPVRQSFPPPLRRDRAISTFSRLSKIKASPHFRNSEAFLVRGRLHCLPLVLSQAATKVRATQQR